MAQMVSEIPGGSDCSRPSIHAIPAVRVSIQAETAAPLTAVTNSAAARPPRTTASSPAASCATATAMNSRATVGCAACALIMAAWTSRAPIDVRPASYVVLTCLRPRDVPRR